jgi:hypothetical protein
LKLLSAKTGRDQCVYFRLVLGVSQVLGAQGRARAARELPGGAGGAEHSTELLAERSGKWL